MEETKSRAYSHGAQSGVTWKQRWDGKLGVRVPHLAVVNLDKGHGEMLKVNRRGPNNRQELRRFKPLTGDCDQSGMWILAWVRMQNRREAEGIVGGSWQVENVKSAH